ncbi:hypothetical protein OfM1_14620 [Lactovum odontotermitis]
MLTVEKNTQANFRTNDKLLAAAKKIFAQKNMDMTSAFNFFLEKTVEENDLPFYTDTDAQREQVIMELRAELRKGHVDILAGRVHSEEEVRKYFDI